MVAKVKGQTQLRGPGRCWKPALLLASFASFGGSPALAEEGLRLAHGSLEAGYEFQYWEPRGIPDVFYETIGVNLLQADGEIGVAGLPLIDTFSTGFHYEWTPGSEDDQVQLVALRQESEAAWEQYAGNLELGVPFLDAVARRFSIEGVYTEQHFLVAAQALKDYWYYSDGGVDLLVPGDTISQSMTIRLLEIGPRLAYLDARERPWVILGAGGFKLGYRKPYTHETFTVVDRSFIFDSTFEGVGGALRSTFFWHAYEEGRPFVVSLRVMGGPATIKLDDVDAEDVLPSDTDVWLLDLHATLDLPFVQLSFLSFGAAFDYTWRAFGDPFGGSDAEDVDVGQLNDDHIFGVSVQLAASF